MTVEEKMAAQFDDFRKDLDALLKKYNVEMLVRGEGDVIFKHVYKTTAKMSKSRGNGISVDEVVQGVSDLEGDYHFVDTDGDHVNHKEMGVWRGEDGLFYTAKRFGQQPVFLVEK